MKRLRSKGGFTLIELLIVIIIIGILAAIAIPMFLNQRDKAKEAGVKEGVHSLQIGVQTYAVDYNDVYPPSGDLNWMNQTYVDLWPKNAFPAGGLMISATTQGNYQYTKTATNFRLIGYGKTDGLGIITVP